MTRIFCNSRKQIKRLLAPAQRRRPAAICFCFAAVFRQRRKTCVANCPRTTILLFLPPTAGERNRTEKADSYKGLYRKNKSAGLFRGKQLVFPSGGKPKQEAGANHPFPQESALCRRWRQRIIFLCDNLSQSSRRRREDCDSGQL